MTDLDFRSEDEPEKPPKREKTSRPLIRPYVPLLNNIHIQAKSLLYSSGVVRDPLHGDIRITRLEKAVIDTQVFQRLRHVNQLAMVDFVYPGAVHNRFLHSLGTLHICAEMMTHCKNSVRSMQNFAPPKDVLPVQIPHYAELLARFVALLHDAAHVPFGHVFEREAQVFKKDEWQDSWRVGIVFGPESELRHLVRAFFVEHFSTGKISLEKDVAMAAADQLMDDVKNVLTAKDQTVYGLPYPFVYDLVGNTICADLLDYVQRDMYFSGLTESFGRRFLRYLAVAPTAFDIPSDVKSLKQLPAVDLRPHPVDTGEAFASMQNGKTVVQFRVVLMQYRYNKRRAPYSKDNILPEAIDLVRRRKLVAEKLYFHPTKLIATSMLSAAAHSAGIDDAKAVWDLSDHEVLRGMESGTLFTPTSSDRDLVRRARARSLAGKLLRRELFKPIFRVGYHPDIEDDTGRRLWHRAAGGYRRFSIPGNREELIEVLEAIIGLYLYNDEGRGVGHVSISCPDRKMQLKEFEMLVLPRPDMELIKPLQKTVRPTIQQEIQVIQTAHHELWRLEVFVAPEIFEALDRREDRSRDDSNRSDPTPDLNFPPREFLRRLAGAIEWEVGLANELMDFFDAIPAPANELLREMQLNRELLRYKVSDRITQPHYKLLTKRLAAFGVDSIRSHLIDMKYLDA
jgi:HD superfamily phosphohydrolase